MRHHKICIFNEKKLAVDITQRYIYILKEQKMQKQTKGKNK